MEKGQLTLVGHLSELRKRIIIICILITLGTIISYRYIDTIIKYMVRPAGNLEFIYLSPPELFVAYIKIAIVVGMIISSPITLIQVWLFIKPGLKINERKHLLLALYLGIAFFLAGAVFAYFTIIPITIEFFTQVSVQQIVPLFSFNSYLSFITSLLFAFGLVFELPLLIILLTQLGLVTANTLRKYRKIVILIIFIIAAVLTPPDVVSQILLGLPMVFLYEISIWISAWLGRKSDE